MTDASDDDDATSSEISSLFHGGDSGEATSPPSPIPRADADADLADLASSTSARASSSSSSSSASLEAAQHSSPSALSVASTAAPSAEEIASRTRALERVGAADGDGDGDGERLARPSRVVAPPARLSVSPSSAGSRFSDARASTRPPRRARSSSVSVSSSSAPPRTIASTADPGALALASFGERGGAGALTTAASEETRAWRRASPTVRRWLEEKERKAASLARLKTRRARADVSWIVNRRKHQMAIFRRDRANDEREARRELVAARSDGALALLLGRPDPSLSPSSPSPRRRPRDDADADADVTAASMISALALAPSLPLPSRRPPAGAPPARDITRRRHSPPPSPTKTRRAPGVALPWTRLAPPAPKTRTKQTSVWIEPGRFVTTTTVVTTTTKRSGSALLPRWSTASSDGSVPFEAVAGRYTGSDNYADYI
jgi:hypothetical protein